MVKPSVEEKIPWFTAITTFVTYITVILVGNFLEVLHRVILRNKIFQTEKVRTPIVPATSSTCVH